MMMMMMTMLIFGNRIFKPLDEEECQKFRNEVSEISTEIHESQLTEESYKVAVTIAGYVERQLP